MGRKEQASKFYRNGRRKRQTVISVNLKLLHRASEQANQQKQNQNPKDKTGAKKEGRNKRKEEATQSTQWSLLDLFLLLFLGYLVSLVFCWLYAFGLSRSLCW